LNQYLGAGPRICIGAAFATLEATVMLATFVRAARFGVAPDFRPQPSGQLFTVPEKRNVDARGLAPLSACYVCNL
jgi:cytochrome P450